MFPTVTKWACIYSTKARARYLDMVRLFADASFERYPAGSICLDAPLILLDPDHPDANRTRPSNLAQACDLFTDPDCYRILRLVEDDIVTRALFRALDPILYVVTALDTQLAPAAILAVDYGEAVAQLRELATPTPKPNP